MTTNKYISTTELEQATGDTMIRQGQNFWDTEDGIQLICFAADNWIVTNYQSNRIVKVDSVDGLRAVIANIREGVAA